MHRQFGDAVELFLLDPDIAQPRRQAEIGDQPGDQSAAGALRSPSASLTRSWRSALTGWLKRSTCGSITHEV